MSRNQKVIESARRAMEKSINDIDEKITQKHFAAVGFGRAGSRVEFATIQDICINGFRKAAESIRSRIFEYDGPNASSYLESYKTLLQNLSQRVLEAYRFSGGFSPVSNFMDRAEVIEFRLSLDREKDNAIADYELAASKPTIEQSGGLSEHDLKVAILREFAKTEKSHKINLLGRPYQAGPLESSLGSKFTEQERNRAARCFDALYAEGLLDKSNTDIADPDNWYSITEAGREALKRGAVDELDAALIEIDPRLCDLRHGAWAAAMSSQPDAVRQAAHSARELIIQTLDAIAPIELIIAEPGFQRAKESASGVTRKMRFKYALNKRKSGSSKNDVEILESAAGLLESMHKKMSGLAHQRGVIAERDIKTYLQTTETALALLLL